MNGLTLNINLKRLKETLDRSAEIGAVSETGLSRLALSKEDKEMRDLFKKWMEEAGLHVRIDDFGNMYGRREGKTELPPVLIGSHLDTQPGGGRFDGILGVLSALEVIRTLNDHNVETIRPIEIVNFTNEEGARFEPPMLGSGGMSGVLDKQYVYNIRDREGKRFGDELEKIGYKGEQSHRAKEIHSYIELHIEQGPVLEHNNMSIGAVKGIQGMAWLEVTVRGESDHAGTTPMSMRRDALVAASEMIIGIEDIGKQLDAHTTVGRISVRPNVANCIPEEVVFSVDIRHFEGTTKNEAIHKIKQTVQAIATKRNLSYEIKELWNVKAAVFHPYLVNLIYKTAQENGYPVMEMISGAGHDSKYVNEIAPTAMIFVPSVNGKSHHESELTLDEDIERGANVLARVVYDLAMNENEITQ